MNKPILLSKHSLKKICILPCATTFKAQDSVSNGLWGQRPLIVSLLFFSYSNRTLKWLNPSLDNLASLPSDVFGLTFPLVALHLLGLFSWPHKLLHFIGLISSHTWIQSSSFLQGGCWICCWEMFVFNWTSELFIHRQPTGLPLERSMIMLKVAQTAIL